MGIPFDRNKTDKPEYPTPPTGEQIHLFIGQCENSRSKAGNKMLVLSCVVMDDSEGAGFDCKEYLTEGSYFNYNAACIMNATGIDIDAIDVVDDMTFRGFDAAVIFKMDTWKDKEGKDRKTIKIDKWVPRAEAAIPLAPDPAKGVADVQAPSEPADDEDVCPF